jgi:putative PIN family toxin of toxin-antitoxin system
MLVLDTNVVVAAVASRTGASNWLLDGVLAGQVEMAVSVALVLEYEAVLKRRSMLDLVRITDEEIEALLDAVIARAVHASPIDVSVRPAANDPGDDMLIECALTAGADTIVSMNVRDLAAAAARHRLRLQTPREAVVDLRGKGVSW